MKTTLCLTLTLIVFVMLMFVPNSFAQDESPEYVVQVIYFLPKDREPDPDIDTKLDTLMKDAQQYFANQMVAHGFDGKTFRLETNTTGKVVVHHVNGKFNEAYYQNLSTGSWIVFNEIEELFDMSKNIYFLALGTSGDFLDGGENVRGRAGGSSLNGRVLVPAATTLFVTIHELGHAFGLPHDYRFKDKYISSNIGHSGTDSFCAAQWLNEHRYFNPIQKDYNENTSVEMLTPSLAEPPYGNIRLRFKVTDPDGLHQAQLLFPSFFGSNPSDSSLVTFQELSGKNDVIVELSTDELEGVNHITLLVLDRHGNFSWYPFDIDVADLLPQDVVSIPDPNLASEVRERLKVPPGIDITRLRMHKLRSIIGVNFITSQITDLIGLEHAINIGILALRDQQIRDIKPLAGLQRLYLLELPGNQIDDITPLTGLTNLQHLRLWKNKIENITPLTGLTNLQSLEVGGNQIDDITPLAGLTNLQHLRLHRNTIDDITPLTGLTNLQRLGLNDNKINDIRPLAGLTNLQSLEVGGNQIDDITPLTGLTNLQRLSLYHNKINDIRPLAGLTNLQSLEMKSIQISNISPLAGLTNLTHLYLRDNQITDVSPLAELVNLRELRLEGNPIKDRKPLFELLEKNPDIEIYLKYGGDPLPVTLSHFRAEHTDAGVVIKWTTESEVDNAGFYIYRSRTKDGEFNVVNPTMIQGAGTTGERNEYAWTDTSAKPNTVYYYRIEDVSHAGVHKQLATVRLRGLMSARDKLTTRWADLKTQSDNGR